MAAFFLFISFMPCDNSVSSKITGKCYWTVNRFLKSPRDGSDLSLRAAKTTNPITEYQGKEMLQLTSNIAISIIYFI